MKVDPEPKELHDRAGQAAKETRETIIKLTAASIGVLAFISTREITPALDGIDKGLIFISITFLVASLSAAVWFGFADAQWAYWWATFLSPEHPDQRLAEISKNWWHKQKASSEKLMLAFFVVAAIFMGLFLLSRLIKL